MSETIDKLQKLSELFDAGIITKDELESEKAKVLGATAISSPNPRQMKLPRKWLYMGTVAIACVGLLAGGIALTTRKTPEELYSQGVAYVKGNGVPKDVEKGIKLLTRSANKGNDLAMREVAQTLVSCGRTDEGLIWFDKAIQAGDATSAKYLGKAYMFGNDYFPQDYTKAVHYNKTAIELDQSDAEPYVNLGACYYNGDGTGVDYSNAFECFRRAADLNSPEGLFNLGLCYDNGNGVTRNHEEAVNIFRKAASLGSQPAINYINELERLERERRRRIQDAYDNQLVTCPDCHGSGMVYSAIALNYVSCGTCSGTGYTAQKYVKGRSDFQRELFNMLWNEHE